MTEPDPGRRAQCEMKGALVPPYVSDAAQTGPREGGKLLRRNNSA
jgi:hypothetical protein